MGFRINRRGDGEGEPFFSATGYQKSGEEKLVAQPTVCPPLFMIDGVFPKSSELKNYRQTLDPQTGILSTEYTWNTHQVRTRVAIDPDTGVISQESRVSPATGVSTFDGHEYSNPTPTTPTATPPSPPSTADRPTFSTSVGNVVDGDQILALIADRWQAEGRLTGEAVVATVMSNMGLERHLAAKNLALHRTAVGDRYVGERMREAGCNLGGEQSGHMIMSDFGTTGDGLVAALQVLAVLVEEGRPASAALRRFHPLPQKLVNIRHAGGAPHRMPDVVAAIAAEETTLGSRGRVLIRASGTEPVIRVMAEAEDEALLEATMERLLATIRRAAAP